MRAFSGGAFEIGVVILDGSGIRDFNESDAATLAYVRLLCAESSAEPHDVLHQAWRESRWDVCQAGPLHTAARVASELGIEPLISVSWAYDILRWAKSDLERRSVIASVLRLSQGLLVDSPAITARLLEIGGSALPSFLEIPWGIDLNRFSRLRYLEPEGERRVFTCVRAWEPSYGVLEVARSFLKATSSAGCGHLQFAGSGSLAPELQELVARGAGRVSQRGWLPPSELPELLAGTDVFVSFSESDGTSISLLEAMASGLAVIVADNPSNRLWVEEGSGGWLVPYGDEDAMQQAIQSALAATFEELGALGRRNRQECESRADWRHNASRYLDFVRGVAHPGED